MLTENEKTILRFLMSSFKDHSINEIAKKCSLTPNGAYKILKKFEKEGILKYSKISNIKSYKINFNNKKTSLLLEYALIPELRSRLKYRLEDLKKLQDLTKCCILFGSYINLKKEPNDLDVLFVLNRKDYKKYNSKLKSIKEITPVKVHDIIQTEKDLKNNIIKGDKVIMEILKKGVILWGQKLIVKVVSDVNKK